MDSGIIACAVVPHTPRMAIEADAPDFVSPLIEGLREFGEWLDQLAPDCVVLQSTHWVSTFNWFTTAHPRHTGLCVADEAPDIVPGLPYDYPGDAELARAIADAGNQNEVPFRLNDCEHYRWDYGAYVPLHYIDPAGQRPVVTLPTVVLADLEECMQVGACVDQAARNAGRRVVFVASTALSHALVRGPEQWPENHRRELDQTFIEMLHSQDLAALRDWLPTYAQDAVAEMGGRVLAGFIGALDAMTPPSFGVRQFGAYAQSSGSGNQTLACSPLLS